MGLLRYYAGTLFRKAFPSAVVGRVNRVRRGIRARRHEVARTRAIKQYGYFDANQLREELALAGVRKGGLVMVHSAFGRFYNFKGTALDVLNVLEDLVGPEGTLVMPTHTPALSRGSRVFDVRKSAPQTGILPELFRRTPGTRRSLHPMFSVCAKGPLAETLVAEHHKDPSNAFGARSPYAKLAKYDGQVLGLGLPPGFTSILHVMEAVEPDNFPEVFSGKSLEFVLVDENDRRLTFSMPEYSRRAIAVRDVMRVVRHLSEGSHRTFSVGGVPAFLAHAKPFLEEHRLLTNRGITMYG